ncbi:anti-sigma U factor RsuA [Actinoallomurus vinaceus]|uniref:Anti-sigma U factor RsuA n=1 Tax=Actinoallomurus vinaceus TaxID=1080074 RepID=A0ABP8UEB6_9ACTN
MTERGEEAVPHTDVGAYALGLLEEDDRLAFEAHLAGCPDCSAEVADLSGMRELLTDLRLEPEAGLGTEGPVEIGHGAARLEDAAPGAARQDAPERSADVTSLLRRRRAAARRRRRGTAILSAAAGVALLAGGVTVGAAVAGHGGGMVMTHDHANMPADLLGWGETHSATSPRTGASGIVAMEKKAWGTHVALDLGNVKGPLTCRLVAVNRSGQRHVVTEWAVPPKGYGVLGSPDHLQVHGGTAVSREDLARFDVEVEGGGTLLSIPV